MDVDPFLEKLARAARHFRELWEGNAPYSQIVQARQALFEASLIADQAEIFRIAGTRMTGDGGRMNEASAALSSPGPR